MNDAPLCEREEKRETPETNRKKAASQRKTRTKGWRSPARRGKKCFRPSRRGAKLRSREGAPNSNLAAKRAMAADLIGMGFSVSQACRILHLSRHELGKRGNAGAAERPERRSK